MRVCDIPAPGKHHNGLPGKAFPRSRLVIIVKRKFRTLIYGDNMIATQIKCWGRRWPAPRLPYLSGLLFNVTQITNVQHINKTYDDRRLLVNHP